MESKVLFVDDEPSVLEGIRRQLRRSFAVSTAQGGPEALRLYEEEGPFAVVVSDMRMPGMNGAELLSRIRAMDAEAVRIVLSGQSELTAAIDAVNQGGIFRFLTKPCARETLVGTLEEALELHRLRRAERDLLEQTLTGAVKVVADVLGMANADAFSRARQAQTLMEAMTTAWEIPDPWEFQVAALLSQIGCITVPPETVAKATRGEPLSPLEATIYDDHPAIGARLLRSIPRLERAARMIERQKVAEFDAQAFSGPPAAWDRVELGAQTLRAIHELERRVARGATPGRAVRAMKADPAFPASVVAALGDACPDTDARVLRSLEVSQLRPQMVLEQDVFSSRGLLLARQGQELSEAILCRLQNFDRGVGVQAPVRVLVIE